MPKFLTQLALVPLLFAAVRVPTAQPMRAEYADAENFDEAVGMAIGTTFSSESVRDRCATLFPDLQAGLERNHLVYRVDLARLVAVAWSAADPRLEEELPKVAASAKRAIDQLLADSSDRTRTMCVGSANEWVRGDDTFRERSPKAAAFLDEYAAAHPFDRWTDWKLGFIGGCVKQGLNRGGLPGAIEPLCMCSWDRIRNGMTEAEYEAYGEAVENARLSESPEARKLVTLTVDCALASTDQNLEDPSDPLGAARARRNAAEANGGASEKEDAAANRREEGVGGG